MASSSNVRQFPMDTHRFAALLFANAAAGVAVVFVLAGALLARRLFWLGRARSAQHDALTAEMTASFSASSWPERTKWGSIAGRRA